LPVVVIAVLAVVVVAGGVAAWRWLDRSDYQQAMAWMPPETLRATYTDWGQVRGLAAGESLDDRARPREVDRFLERAYEQDLTSTSAISASTRVLAQEYGFSPLGASWEAFAQSREGAVVVLKLDGSTAVAGIEANLRRLGYEAPPDGAGSGGVWQTGIDQVARIDGALTPVMLNVAVLPEEQVVLLSDSAAYAGSAAEVVDGSAEGLADTTDGVASMAATVEDPATAIMYASDFACEALGTADADRGDQELAERLVSDAGEISPLSGLVLARRPDRSLTVVMHFENDDQAESNLRPRVQLASGEAVGQGGTFPERFRLTSATAQGAEVVLRLRPVATDDSAAFLLSDLSQGPLLFATC